MAGPWEQFQQPAEAPAEKASEGPWNQFAPKQTESRAMTVGQAEAEKDQKLLQQNAGAVPDELKAFGYSAANAAGYNIPSHIVAAATTAQTGRNYWDVYKEQKDYEAALERQNPKAAMAGTVAGTVGGLAVPLGPAAKIATGTTKALTPYVGKGVAQAAGVGALGAGLSGASSLIEKPGEYKQAAESGLLGGALGAGLTPIIGKAAQLTTKIDKGDVAAAAQKLGLDTAPNTMTGKAVNKLATALENKPQIFDPQTQTFSPEAMKAINRATENRMSPDDIKSMQQELIDAMTRKGTTEAAVGEALATKEGLPISREMVTGQRAPASAAPIAEEARIAGMEKIQRDLAGMTPTRPPLGEQLHGELVGARQAAQNQYDLTFSHPGFFSEDISNNIMPTIKNTLAQANKPTDFSNLSGFENAKEAMDAVRKTIAAGEMPMQISPASNQMTMQNLKYVHSTLNDLWAKSSDKERVMIDEIKRGFMKTLDDAVTNNLFYGGNGAQVIADLKKADKLWSDYRSTFHGKGGPTDAILKRMVDKFRDPQTRKITSNIDPAAAEAAQAIINSTLINPQTATQLYDKLQFALKGAAGPTGPVGMRTVQNYMKNGLLDLGPNANFGKDFPKRVEQLLSPDYRLLTSKVFTPAERTQLRRMAEATRMINARKITEEEKASLMATAFKKLAPSIVSGVSAIFHGPVGAFFGTLAGETAMQGIKGIGAARAARAERAGAPVVRPEVPVPPVPIRNYPALTGPDQEPGYENPPALPPLTIRPGRKSGGRVSDRLVTMVDRAKKNINNQTEELLKTPDTHVAQALEVANRHLED